MTECSICPSKEEAKKCSVCGAGPYCKLHLTWHKHNSCGKEREEKK